MSIVYLLYKLYEEGSMTNKLLNYVQNNDIEENQKIYALLAEFNKLSGHTYRDFEREVTLSLYHILKDKDPEFIQFFIKKEKEITKCLHQAFRDENIEIASFLLKNGADINAVNENKAPILHTVLQTQNIDLLEFALNQGANVNSQNGYTKTALHEAVFAHNIIAIKCLLRHGADINAVDRDGKRPAHEVMESYFRDNSLEVFQLLFKHGADINAVNKWGDGVLGNIDGVMANDLIQIAARFNELYTLFESNNLNVFYDDLSITMEERFAVYAKFYNGEYHLMPSQEAFEAFLNKDFREDGSCNRKWIENILTARHLPFIRNEIVKVHGESEIFITNIYNDLLSREKTNLTEAEQIKLTHYNPSLDKVLDSPYLSRFILEYVDHSFSGWLLQEISNIPDLGDEESKEDTPLVGDVI